MSTSGSYEIRISGASELVNMTYSIPAQVLRLRSYEAVFTSAGAALTAGKLAQLINRVCNRKQCLQMAVNARTQGKPRATEDVAKFCIKAAKINNQRLVA